MTDATTEGLTEHMYCSQQINVPLNLPYILKQYAKAAIRTQPSDLLYWSAVYFRALADGETPPVKERIEYPSLSTPSGLSPGFLKVLINRFGKGGVVFERDIEASWIGVGLQHAALEEIFKMTGNEKNRVRWLNFVAVAAGYLCPSLTQTMILICELLTNDPDGGPAAIQLDVFLPLYKYLARLNCGPIHKRESEGTTSIDEICETRQHSLVSVQVPTAKKDLNELNEEIEGEIYPTHYKSDEGLEVWQDVEPPFKKSDTHFSQEGQTSEAGLAVFENAPDEPITPGYSGEHKKEKTLSTDKTSLTEKTSSTKKLSLTKKPSPAPEKSVSLPKDADQMKVEEKTSVKTPVPSETGVPISSKEKISKETKGDETGDQVDETANAEGTAKELENKEGGESFYAIEQKRIQEELKARLQEEKRKKDEERAERKRIKEEAKAEKKRLKEEKKMQASGKKEPRTDDQKDAEKKKKRKKKIFNEAGEVVGEIDEEEEAEALDIGDYIDEEELEDESSTASSTISIDPDLEVISSSQILGEDEVWEEIEIEEESLDDEENKITRKVKKRVKKKMPKKSIHEDESPRLSELEREAKRAADLEHELEMKRLQQQSESLEGMKGRPKEEVRVSGMLNLCTGAEDMVSLMSEPEVFEDPVASIPGIGPIVSERQIKKVVKYMTECSSRQGGYVMPRNIRHFLSPPLDLICTHDNSFDSTTV